MEAYVQPFPLDYGLRKNGKPTRAFLEFVEDEETLTLVVNAVAETFGFSRKIAALLDVLLPKESLCIGTLWLFSYSNEDLKTFYQKTSDLESFWGLSDRIECDTKTFTKEALSRLCSNFKQNQEEEIEVIRHCMNKADIVYIGIKLVLTEEQLENDNLDLVFPKTGYLVHSTQLVIDLSTMVAYRLESSLSPPGEYSDKLENIIDHGIERTIKELFGIPVTLITFDQESCPRFNIQGETSLCSVWSVYLLALYILNYPISRAKLYQSLESLGQRRRNRLILQFLYYLYNNIEAISLFNPDVIIEKKLPKW